MKLFSKLSNFSYRQLGIFTQNIKHWEEKEGQTWPDKSSRLYMQPYRMAEATHIHILSIEVNHHK